MFKKSAILLVFLFCLLHFSNANQYNALFDDAEEDTGADGDSASADTIVERQEATQFLKRLFHPFSTKNEEIKRETREVYEEKCESIIPTQRYRKF
jgi:hypothetical protein